VRYFIFSSTAAVYGNPARVPVREDDPTVPTSPYGSSKLMTEIMLRDAGAAHGLPRDPSLLQRGRRRSARAQRPIDRGGHPPHQGRVRAALGLRAKMQVFGTDYSTPDGTCIRDYIHVSDLVRAHSDALAYLRGGGASVTLNCGYGRGFSVLEVIEMKRVSGVDFKVELTSRRAGDPAHIVAASDRARALNWQPRFDDLQTIVRHAWPVSANLPCARADDASLPIPRCFCPSSLARAGTGHLECDCFHSRDPATARARA
jgi:UDP-glucose 4-epimerase